MTARNPQRKALNRHALIEQNARKLLKQQGITSPPIPVREIAEGLKIHVRFQPFTGQSDVSAVLKRDHEKAVIGVNSMHTATRQRFSIAHELGHYHLHEDEKLFVDFGSMTINRPNTRYRNDVSGQGTDREEIEANSFAAALLMPRGMVKREREALLEEYPDLPPDRVTTELARRFQVSEDAMHYRLLNLGLLVTLG